MQVDYDAIQNSAGWQRTVGCGTDNAADVKIFNPWIQQHKFDYDCVYIKKWVPELSEVPVDAIHNWNT